MTAPSHKKPRNPHKKPLPKLVYVMGIIILVLLALLICLLLRMFMFQQTITTEIERVPASSRPDLITTSTTEATSTPTELSDEEIEELLANNNPMTIGDPDAPVVVTKYSDYECPFCVNFFRQVYEPLREQYVDTGKVLVRRHSMPLYYHNYARPAERASLCASEYDQYWEMHDLLYTNAASWTNEKHMEYFAQYAETLGLPVEEFTACVTSERYKAKIDQDIADGITLGLTGIPTVYIGTTQHTNIDSWAEFQELIEAELAVQEAARETER